MHHDIGAPVAGPAQVGRRHRVVDHQRNFRLVRDFRQRLDVDDIDERIAKRLGVEKLGVFPDV